MEHYTKPPFNLKLSLDVSDLPNRQPNHDSALNFAQRVIPGNYLVETNGRLSSIVVGNPSGIIHASVRLDEFYEDLCASLTHTRRTGLEFYAHFPDHKPEILVLTPYQHSPILSIKRFMPLPQVIEPRSFIQIPQFGGIASFVRRAFGSYL